MNRLSTTVVRTMFIFIVLLTVLTTVGSTFYYERSAQAAYNLEINYQGKLTNGSNVAVADGTYNMRFKLYDDLTVGSDNLLWTETRTSGDRVQVTNGVFSVMLGEVNPFGALDFNQTLFLSVDIGGTGGSPSWDGEMVPRKKIGTVPTAFLASNLKGTGLVDITNTATQATFNYDGSNRATLGVASNGFTTLTAVGAGAGWNLTGGNVGIGTATTSAKLHVTSTTEQLRVGYDAANYSSFTTSSGGDLTIAPSGSDLAITGNVDTSGTLTSGTADAFSVNASGVVTAGTWQGTVVGSTYGGTGINNGSNTITLGGNINTAAAFTTAGANALTLTTTGATNVTLPTTGTLITSGVTTLSSLVSIGTITTGVWNGTAIAGTYGGTGINTASSTGVPSISSGTWSVNAQLPVSLGGTGTNNGSITGTGALSFTAGGAAQNVNLVATTTGSAVVSSTTANTDTINFKPQTTGTGATFAGIITTADLTGSDKTYTFPNASITVNAAADISGSTLASGVTASSLTSVGTLSSLALSGAITGATGVTSSGTITFSGLGGGGTQCVRTDNVGVLSAAACGGGALTPWTSDIDADGFDLNDLSNLEFRDTTGAPAGSVVAIYRDNTGDLNLNSLTAKTTNIQVNGTDEYNFSSSGLAFNSNNITGLGTGLTATAGLTITSTSANLALATSGSGDITATTAGASGLFNVLTGNLKVGAGTPGLTLNGDDAYITGTFEVDSTTQFDGATTFNSTTAFNGVSTFNTDVDFTFAGTENLNLTNTTGSNAVDLFALTITNNDAGAASQRGLVLTNANSTSTTESLLFIDNADTTASSLTDGLLITSSGVNDGITDAIDVSAANITNALNVGANTITGAGYLVTSTASGLTINSTNAALTFQTTTAGDITFTPAAAESVQITSTVTSGLTTSAAVSIAANSLTTGTGLYMASSTLSSGSLVDLQVSGTAGASSQKVINAVTTGAITGTQTTYGGFFSNTHSGGTSTNIALYATATGGTNNYAAIFEAGNVGVGTTGPDRKLDILDASNPQLRLTTTDGTVYSDMQNTANANVIVSGSSLASSSAQQFGLQITPTINQTSTASYRGLDVNVTETAVASANGLNRLADFRVGSSSKLAIANNGSITLQDASNLVSPYASIGAFQNHLVRSEEFDNASWTKTSVTAPTANTQVAPDGSTTAESLATSGSGGDVCQFTSTAAASSTFTFSVWVRSTSGTQNFDLRVDAGATSCATANNVTGTAVTHTATASWQRFSVTQTFSGATGNAKARIFPGGTAGTGTVYAAKAQLEINSNANAYALTTSGALTNTNRGESIVSNFATQSGFTYGGRHIINLEGAISASSTTVGQLIRVNDNATGTDDTATVRGLEVQSYSGTNINGVNTAIAGFGYTFGVHAVSTGQANESAQPAAVFADLDNGSAPTQGNAIRAYTNNATSADLFSIYQETSAYSGNAMEININGTFTGNFADFQTSGTTKFKVDKDGNAFATLNTGNSERLCWDGAGGTAEEIFDCTGTPGDLAENFGTNDPSIEAMDIVVSDGHATDIVKKGEYSTKAYVEKSTKGYQSNIIGVVSTNPNEVYANDIFTNAENPRPVALVGRVPVKVTLENGPIVPGDYITSSNSESGKGMKATRSGMVVGQALSGYDGTGQAQVIIFVNTGFQSIGNSIILDAPSTNGINLQSGDNSPMTNTASTFLIQQQTSGDQDAEANILQLQTGDANRFMVSSSGATSILSNLNCEADADSCPSVLKVTQADTELMNIDARGTLTLAGTIVIKDDTFAGSVATDEDGLAEITFTYHLGTGKPVVQLTAEAQIPVFAQIVEFKQDDNGNYTGFVMKTFDLISSPIQAIVHYNVVGKQAGYITLGEAVVTEEVLELFSENGNDHVGLIIEGGEVVGNENDQSEESSSNDEGSVSGDFTTNSPDGNIISDENQNSESDSGLAQ